jgi:hypothetical protein
MMNAFSIQEQLRAPPGLRIVACFRKHRQLDRYYWFVHEAAAPMFPWSKAIVRAQSGGIAELSCKAAG